MRTQKTRRLKKFQIPSVRSSRETKSKEYEGFPLDHFSTSSLTKFATNPFMFKVNSINGETLDTPSSAPSVLGSALHKALQVYLGGNPDVATPTDEGEAIKCGHAFGLEYLDNYSDGYIGFNKDIPSRERLNEKYAFCYFKYISEFNFSKAVGEILIVEKKLKYKIEVNGKVLPIPLEGHPDLVYRDTKGRICIVDHKFTRAYSQEDATDADKMLQASFLYFLVYAETGESPYSIVFREFKHIENTDKSPQTRPFQIVYKDAAIIFQFFFRIYQDVTDALMGKQVYIPNFHARYDKEVSILAYIHRLDVDKERADQFKELQVDNITDFLKKKIQSDVSMKKYLKTVSKKFISSETLNYKTMNIQEKIKMKLAEHGLGVEFEDKVVGSTVTLYRYKPAVGLKMSKIEAYAKDIEQVVEVSNIRVLAPIPDSGFVGFEIPNATRTFPELPTGKGFDIAIGQTIMGKVRRFDIRYAPHMLVAGSAGAGKSVFLNIIIQQLLKIPRIELHLFDPKEVELFHFEEEKKVVEYLSNHQAIHDALIRLIDEMNRRYSVMKKAKVRSIEQMPEMKYKFVIIDEYADLSGMVDVDKWVQMLAQKGRACGIHMIIATQRASTKVISGDIKVNFPTKVVFKMAKSNDSRVMIDEDGAEKLLGMGDMLFVGDHGVERLQGYNI